MVYACPVLRVSVMMSETYFQMVQQRNLIWNEKNMLSSDEVKQTAVFLWHGLYSKELTRAASSPLVLAVEIKNA